MARKTIIFGNGLGMALNPTYFSIDRAIGVVWNDSALLNSASKELIIKCLPRESDGRPHGENELDTLQLALSACDFLNGIENSGIHWLSDDGQEFPQAVRQFIYQTALQFHQREEDLPNTFLDPLADFIKDTKSHVATLNYDNLLYQPLIDREVLSGYSGALVDGFHNSGFDVENLERRYGRTFGYYLHLHGSPLFVDRRQNIIKLGQSNLAEQTDTVSSHIVLTHFKHKSTVISASVVLFNYWRKLVEALSESEEILLIGYSGADTHLNHLIRGASDLPIRIVEWEGAGGQTERMTYWSDLFSREVTLERKTNILEFQEW